MSHVVICSSKRTPIGKFCGALATLPAPKLGAAAIKGVLDETQIEPGTVDQVIMGNVLQAGIGQAPARQAGLYAGLPESVGAITLHKVCGSGLRAVMDAHNAIKAGEWEVVIAGGMENMSLAPHILANSRKGYRMGDIKAIDSLVHDGLTDPYSGRHMGECAELCAEKYDLSRAAQDAFALDSYTKSQSAIEAGHFSAEMVAVEIPQRKGDPVVVDVDEEPFASPLDKMAKLRPAFKSDGTITAANASKINDGAAALLVCSQSKAESLGLKPQVRLVAQASCAQTPEWFTTAPAFASQQCLDKAGLKVGDIDLWEINEAFAAVTMACVKELDIAMEKVNVRGGAVAFGHPIGASGARILTTLIHTLLQEKKRYGLATLCIGGGEAVALLVENIQTA
jgi:acetyl-CoA C-acetyltransferase